MRRSKLESDIRAEFMSRQELQLKKLKDSYSEVASLKESELKGEVAELKQTLFFKDTELLQWKQNARDVSDSNEKIKQGKHHQSNRHCFYSTPHPYATHAPQELLQLRAKFYEQQQTTERLRELLKVGQEEKDAIQFDMERELTTRKRHHRLEHIRVFCRIRPLLMDDEVNHTHIPQTAAVSCSGNSVQVQDSGKTTKFSFDHVFNPDDNQDTGQYGGHCWWKERRGIDIVSR